jgi:hypothetical protein
MELLRFARIGGFRRTGVMLVSTRIINIGILFL